MTNKEFMKIVRERFELCVRVLDIKRNQYAKEGVIEEESDRLHNFNVASKLRGTTPEDALAGMMVKHIVALFDAVEKLKVSSEAVPQKQLDGYFNDIHNYLFLLEAVIKESKEFTKQIQMAFSGVLPENDPPSCL